MKPYYQDARVTVHAGDCLAVLPDLPDASVDAVVTDPPYGLEFMGREWDSFKTGRSEAYAKGGSLDPEAIARQSGKGGAGPVYVNRPAKRCGHCGRQAWSGSPCTCPEPDWIMDNSPLHAYQAWCQQWAAECLRVLKPGGHLLAFGGTRTHHRLTCGIEDAGFEIRDSITWLYGCHDDQTEVLTDRGWAKGLDLADGDRVAQWSADGTISLVHPLARQRYPYDGRMVRFRNADVDQLVTPNHRVYRQVSERTQVAHVRTAAWSEWQVCEAATVNRWQRMRLPAAGEHDGPGIGGSDYAALLGWVWAEGGFDLTGTGVRIYQSSTNAPLVAEISALLDRLEPLGPHKRYDYPRTWKGRAYTATTWFVSGVLARRVRADLPGKTPTWDLLWRMTAAEKRALWDAAMKGDGSKAARSFWQKDRAALEWAQALLACIGARGKIANDPRGVMHWQPFATVELQRRHLADAGEDYTGEVWCVTVPSGAFVIRRNGRVSVSGNSGFPKSLDVSKAIDAAAGAERELVGSKLGLPGYSLTDGNGDHRTYGRGLGNTGTGAAEVAITAPATDAARQWSGWGTALKPASEPIVVARKPLAGTVAANVLAHGTGALNIDACRVAGGERPVMVMTTTTVAARSMSGESTGATSSGEMTTTGRWPPNVALDDSQAAELDAQSGDTNSSGGSGTASARTKNGQTYGEYREPEAGSWSSAGGFGDRGGASRYFPTFRYEAKADTAERPRHVDTAHPTVKPLDLMRWLVRLVTPPGGVVLDLFAGSGTTGEACQAEGFRCIGIEREADYLPLIVQRLTKRTDPVRHLTDKGADLGLFALLEEMGEVTG